MMMRRISPKINSDYLHLVVYIWIKYDQNPAKGSRYRDNKIFQAKYIDL